MDTGSLLQPGRPFTVFETLIELAGILEVPETPEMTAGYADIYHGYWTSPQGERVEVAVKELRALIPRDRHTEEEALKRKADTRLKREVFVWSRTTHPNLHPLLGYRLHPRPRLVSPWCRHGNLKDYLRAKPDLSRCDKLRMIFQTACGLEHLHAQDPPICHADIKPENVLINDLLRPSLSDFGRRLSRVMHDLSGPSGLTTSETVKGTLRYKAAELSAGQKPSMESDVYAFGGLILTVMSGKAPFHGLEDQVILRRVMQDQPPRPMHHPNLPADDPLWNLMRRCWDIRPAARPTMRVLLELLGQILSEGSNPSSGLGLAPAAHGPAEASSNMDFDSTSAPQQASILSLTSNIGVAGCTSSGYSRAGEMQNSIPENVLVVAQERLKRLELRSKIIPVIGKYIGAVINIGLNVVEIVQNVERIKIRTKNLESSIWKFVTLTQYLEEGLSQYEDDEVPNLVDDIQRELQCVHGEVNQLRFSEISREENVSCNQGCLTRCQIMAQKLSEEVQLLVNLNTTRLLTELGNKELRDQSRRLLNCLGDGRHGAQGNAIEDVICLPGTRVQVLERIDGWVRDASTLSRVLWISGMAGRGKSTIASTVTHKWHYLLEFGPNGNKL